MWQVTSALGTLWDAIPILLAIMALRPVSASELMRYSRRFGLEVNLDTHASIVRSIRRSRTSRLAGAAIGWSAHAVLYVFGVGIPNEGVVYAVLGYLLGAFVAALIPGSPRAARCGEHRSFRADRATTCREGAPCARRSGCNQCGR